MLFNIVVVAIMIVGSMALGALLTVMAEDIDRVSRKRSRPKHRKPQTLEQYMSDNTYFREKYGEEFR